jgi:hypothetical protein
MSSVQLSSTTRDAAAALRLQPAAEGASVTAVAGDDADVSTSSRSSSGRNGRDMLLLDALLQNSGFCTSVIDVLQRDLG